MARCRHLRVLILLSLCWQRTTIDYCRHQSCQMSLPMSTQSQCYLGHRKWMTFQSMCRLLNLWYHILGDLNNTLCFVIYILLINFIYLFIVLFIMAIILFRCIQPDIIQWLGTVSISRSWRVDRYTDALAHVALCLWSISVSWCLAEGCRNRDHCHLWAGLAWEKNLFF